MNRRGFLKALGAAVAVAVVSPVLPVAEPMPVAMAVVQRGSLFWLDLANAVAFNYVGDFQRDFHGPRASQRNERFYREKALLAAHRYMTGRTP